MALPFDRLNPADREMIASLKAQTENLKGQTKVLHSISDQLMRQRKETSAANTKTAKDFQALFGMMNGGFSEIRSYLRSGGTDKKGAPSSSMPDKGFFNKLFSKTAQPSKYETRILEELILIRTAMKSGGLSKDRTSTMFSKDKGAAPDKGFFSNLFGKLFGPSKYQTKVMEEITLLRELSERQTRHLEFLAEQNTDSKRAKEREALATAIVNKMKLLDFGGGDGIGGGMLSTLGKALLTGIGGAIALLGRQIATALRGLLAGIKLALKALETLLDKIFKSFPKTPPVTGPVPGQGGGQGPVPVPEPGGVVPAPVPGARGSPTNRLPPPANVPKLEGPGRPGGFNPNAPPFNQSWKGRFQPPTDVGGRFSPGGAGRGIALALVALGAALGFKIALEDEDKPGGSFMGGSVMNEGDPTKNLLSNIDAQIEMKRQGVKPKDTMELGEALRLAGKDKYIFDPNTGEQITAEQFKKRYGDKLKPEEKKQLEKFVEAEKLEDERLKKERDKLEQEEKGLDLQADFNEALQKGIDELKGFTEQLAEATIQGFKEKAIPYLNKLGEISIQGQKINLAPDLGTELGKTMEDTFKLAKELAEYTSEKFSGKSTNNVNNVTTVNNNDNSTSSLPPSNSKNLVPEGTVLDMFGLRRK